MLLLDFSHLLAPDGKRTGISWVETDSKALKAIRRSKTDEGSFPKNSEVRIEKQHNLFHEILSVPVRGVSFSAKVPIPPETRTPVPAMMGYLTPKTTTRALPSSQLPTVLKLKEMDLIRLLSPSR